MSARGFASSSAIALHRISHQTTIGIPYQLLRIQVKQLMAWGVGCG